jgi:hypothetical protein
VLRVFLPSSIGVLAVVIVVYALHFSLFVNAVPAPTVGFYLWLYAQVLVSLSDMAASEVRKCHVDYLVCKICVI